MKKGMVIASFKDLPFKDLLRAYKRAGFDGVEISMREQGGWLGPDTPETAVLHLRRTAEEVGIELHSVMGGLLWQYPLSSPDPAVREKGMMVVEKGLERCRWLGASALLVVPGVVNEGTSYEQAYERSFAAVKELSPKAEREGVHIAVENVWNKLLLSPMEMVRFIDDVGSDYVGAYFDVGNILTYGYPEQWIRSLGTRICKVHLKDFGRQGFTYLLQGDVNWPDVIQALREVGYDGYLTAELSLYRYAPEQMLRDTAGAIEAILKMGG